MARQTVTKIGYGLVRIVDTAERIGGEVLKTKRVYVAGLQIYFTSNTRPALPFDAILFPSKDK